MLSRPFISLTILLICIEMSLALVLVDPVRKQLPQRPLVVTSTSSTPSVRIVPEENVLIQRGPPGGKRPPPNMQKQILVETAEVTSSTPTAVKKDEIETQDIPREMNSGETVNDSE